MSQEIDACAPIHVGLSYFHTHTHTRVAEWTSVTGRSGGGTRYVSRLEAIKEAVSRQLEHLAITEPKNKVRTEYVCSYECIEAQGEGPGDEAKI